MEFKKESQKWKSKMEIRNEIFEIDFELNL